MNLLTINSFDCSPVASGGVNRITDILSRQFTRHGINCFLGFFETIAPELERTPFVDRILLNRNFDKNTFKAFLLKNKIDIVQVNFLKKHNLITMPLIYQAAYECGAKVIYAFHMCPGFQTVTYGSWDMVRYSIGQHNNILTESKKLVMTLLRPIIKIVEPVILKNKYRYPYDSCDKIVTLSSHYFAPYLRLAGIKTSDKMVAIPNALRFAEYASSEDIQNKEHIALVVARFDEDTKRLSLVLKAWREIEQDTRFCDWKLQLVGDGRDIDFYKYLVNKWELKHVEFTGQQNPQEYYRKASLFLMTSSAEGYPMTLIEAMQMGTPILAMNSYGALHDIVTDSVEGCITRNNNLGEFTMKLKKMLSDEKMLSEMSHNAVKKSMNFTIDNVVGRWLSLFNEISKK